VGMGWRRWGELKGGARRLLIEELEADDQEGIAVRDLHLKGALIDQADAEVIAQRKLINVLTGVAEKLACEKIAETENVSAKT
jgi:hypothetical protein